MSKELLLRQAKINFSIIWSIQRRDILGASCNVKNKSFSALLITNGLSICDNFKSKLFLYNVADPNEQTNHLIKGGQRRQ